MSACGSKFLTATTAKDMDEPQQPLAANQWREVLKHHWTESAQRTGQNLVAENQIDSFTSRLYKVTTHVTHDLSMVVFLGLKMKMRTATELVLDFVVEAPSSPLPVKLDALQLLERLVDKQFNVYLRDKIEALPMSQLRVLRQGFLDSHMEAALMSRLCENDVNQLKPQLKLCENNMESFQNIASGDGNTYFVEGMVAGKPQFTDIVFADYFAAKWFGVHFVENSAFIAQKLYSARRSVMRYLFDCILASGRQLHLAVLHDDFASADLLLLNERVEIDARDAAGRTALHLAAAQKICRQKPRDNVNVMDIIMDHTISIDVVDHLFAGSPLVYADIAKSWVAMDKLLRHGADTSHLPSTSTNIAGAAMLDAIFAQDLDSLLGFCLDKGLPLEYNAQSRLLTRACVEGSLRVAMLLINKGADVNAVEGDIGTPLALASSGGKFRVVQHLVLNSKLATHSDASRHFAYINDNALGTSALHCAVEFGHVDVVAYLIKGGADPWCRNVVGRTPLHEAVACFKRAVPAMLIDAVDAARRADYVNFADHEGNTALHSSAQTGCLQLVRLLGKAGAVVTARNNLGWTPMMVAAMHGKLAILKHLIGTFDGDDIRLKCDFVNGKDDEGKSSLHWAALRGHAAVVEHLVGHGACVDSLDDDGKAPLFFALSHGHGDCVDVLLGCGQ